MLSQLLDFTERNGLIIPGEKILLGISGGIDSVVLAHLFRQAGFDFEFAHCNFMLRGEESDGDEVFVRELANRFQIPVAVKAFNTSQYAQEAGISIQMAARELRRNWFEKLLTEKGLQKIATAHHLNDSIETILLNLTRGTGLPGITGIKPLNGHYIRPLLFTGREAIRQYAEVNNLSWREDSSNLSVKYQRNLLRHQVIPVLKKINPNLEETFLTTSKRLSGASAIYEETVLGWKQKLLEPALAGYRILKSALVINQNRQLILSEIIGEFGFNYTQAGDILNAMHAQPGKKFFSDKYHITLDREYLFISPHSTLSTQSIYVQRGDKIASLAELRFTFTEYPAAELTIDPDPCRAYIDLEKLKYPLAIRMWQAGDRLQPLGMRHKKKVSDLMIDMKIPLKLKERTAVVISGDDIAWVTGVRIDNRYKVTKSTSQVLVINISYSDDQSV